MHSNVCAQCVRIMYAGRFGPILALSLTVARGPSCSHLVIGSSPVPAGIARTGTGAEIKAARSPGKPVLQQILLYRVI